jgi:hypothetical protein
LLPRKIAAADWGAGAELIDTGVFNEDRYSMCPPNMQGLRQRRPDSANGREPRPEKATLHLLPTLWFRNTWSWDIAEECTSKPLIALERDGLARIHHDQLGEYQIAYEGDATPLFTENETNSARLHGYSNGQPFVKDAFHENRVRTDGCGEFRANRDKVRTALRLGDRTREIAGREAAALSKR